MTDKKFETIDEIVKHFYGSSDDRAEMIEALERLEENEIVEAMQKGRDEVEAKYNPQPIKGWNMGDMCGKVTP